MRRLIDLIAANAATQSANWRWDDWLINCYTSLLIDLIATIDWLLLSLLIEDETIDWLLLMLLLSLLIEDETIGWLIDCYCYSVCWLIWLLCWLKMRWLIDCYPRLLLMLLLSLLDCYSTQSADWMLLMLLLSLLIEDETIDWLLLLLSLLIED